MYPSVLERHKFYYKLKFSENTICQNRTGSSSLGKSTRPQAAALLKVHKSTIMYGNY